MKVHSLVHTNMNKTFDALNIHLFESALQSGLICTYYFLAV